MTCLQESCAVPQVAQDVVSIAFDQRLHCVGQLARCLLLFVLPMADVFSASPAKR
jgi:hypothetical protein